MANKTIVLKNSGGIEYNDVADDAVFDLYDNTYQIVLSPKDQFWRFGFRFSSNEKIEFVHPTGRYNNRDYANIELDVGDMKSPKEWTSPNKIELGCYWLPGFDNGHIFNRFESYIPLSTVEVNLRYDQQTSLLYISYAAGAGHFHEVPIALTEVRYFRVIAWADWIDFEIECTIHINNALNPSSAFGQGKQGYWLLKLDPDLWPIDGLRAGTTEWFDTLFLPEKEKRPEYAMYQQILPGDLVLGYAFGVINALVCLFQVTKSIHINNESKEGIELIILSIFNPKIPLVSFQDAISFLEDMDRRSPLRLFSLPEDVYNSIINLTDVPPPPPKRIAFLPPFRTEGNFQATKDQLGFTNDIEAIASVISQKNVNPPLAIGLFGNWGSGKSFFMQKLADQIDVNRKKGNEKYIKHVVAVKFNSWHYHDANLWASLISEIFDSLNKYAQDGNKEEMKKLADTLQFAHLQKEIIESKKVELEHRISALKDTQKEKRRKLEDISGFKLLKLIFSDEKIRRDFSELNNEHVEELAADKSKIDQYLQELKSTKNLVVFFVRTVLSLKGWRWRFVAFFAVVLLVCIFLLKYVWTSQWNAMTLQLSVWATALVTLISKSLAAIKPYRETLQEANERLNSLKKTIESRDQQQTAGLSPSEKALQQLTDNLKLIDDNIQEARSKIDNILSGKKLLTFIEQRSKDTSYAAQLGLISWIRRDFDTLDLLLREQHEMDEERRKQLFNPQNVRLKIDRIILYIDDLDRCNEEIVVKVLEAINLLLAFPLFVVVVGVDPRWLNNALDKKMGDLFRNVLVNPTDPTVAPANQNPATSYDYLEKIFQIPFSIKPINRIGSDALIKELLKKELENQQLADETLKADQGVPSAPVAKTEERPKVPGVDDIPIDKTNSNRETGGPPNPAPPESDDSEPLRLKVEEVEFIQSLSPLFGKTPRSINRYINIYRIIKSHKGLSIYDQNDINEYKPVMFMLAVIVGQSQIASDFVQAIRRPEAKTLNDALAAITIQNGAEMMNSITNVKDFLQTPIADFKKNIELVSRFSFRPII
jgi:hypothetical protein